MTHSVNRPASIQWPCRLPEPMSNDLERIRELESDDKSGVVRRIIKMGIGEWLKNDTARRALSDRGLTIESILPYIGGGRRADKK
jgi:hypothetical protein